MAYRTDDYEVEEEEEPQKRKSRSWSWILIVLLLAGAGSGSAFAWRASGGGQIFSGISFMPAPAAVSSKVEVASEMAARRDLEALQQQIAGSTQSTEKLLTAQQAEIKRLADQVAALTIRLDLLQRPMAALQTPVPEQPGGAPKPPAAAKPVAAKPREAKPANQSGAVSTGGAPLQLNR